MSAYGLVTAVLLGVVGCGKTVGLPPVPQGWTVVIDQQTEGGLLRVMQRESSGPIKPTICIWIDESFVRESPGDATIRGGNSLTASRWAANLAAVSALGKAEDLALGKTEGLPSLTGELSTHCPLDSRFAFADVRDGTIRAVGLCSRKWDEGYPVTCSCADSHDSWEQTEEVFKQLVNSM